MMIDNNNNNNPWARLEINGKLLLLSSYHIQRDRELQCKRNVTIIDNCLQYKYMQIQIIITCNYHGGCRSFGRLN